jgi:GT2 family glycosyltransferase
MKIEVIMAAYNNIKDMRIVLDGYLGQTDKQFLLCIADDGSRNSVKSLLDVYVELGLNIRHVYHEDKGFRKAEIVNSAISSSRADYLVFTDNDCIPSKYFIADHRAVCSEDKLIIGRRVDLYASVSNALRNNSISISKFNSPSWLLFQSAIKGLKRSEIGVRFPAFICDVWNRKDRKAIGANMGISRAALLEINGFDSDYQGYGFEETDLEWRLAKNGIKSQTVLGRCAIFHLYHPGKKESVESLLHLQKKINQGLVKCKNGIEKRC